jgi:hypothetical protein
MSRRKKVTYQGREVEATVLDFTVVDNGTARVRLEDGTELRVRPVVVAVLRLDGERNELGEPVFLVQSLVHTMVDGDVDGGEEDADDASNG